MTGIKAINKFPTSLSKTSVMYLADSRGRRTCCSNHGNWDFLSSGSYLTQSTTASQTGSSEFTYKLDIQSYTRVLYMKTECFNYLDFFYLLLKSNKVYLHLFTFCYVPAHTGTVQFMKFQRTVIRNIILSLKGNTKGVFFLLWPYLQIYPSKVF